MTKKSKDNINIHNIYCVDSFILKQNYSEQVEHHKYWEFVYVHKGNISIRADNKIVDLTAGDLIIHPPFQKHKIERYVENKTVVVVFSFLETSNLLYTLKSLKTKLSLNQRNIIKNIFTDIDSPSKYIDQLTRMQHPPVYLHGKDTALYQQRIKKHLEIFLIDLILDQNSKEKEESFHHNIESNKAKCENIISYMQNNLYKNLTLDDICRYSYLGKTSVSTMFKRHTNMSVMKYFTYLKVQKAKELLKTNASLDEISKALNFTSQNYFSRAFKSIEGVSPFKYRQMHKKY